MSLLSPFALKSQEFSALLSALFSSLYFLVFLARCGCFLHCR